MNIFKAHYSNIINILLMIFSACGKILKLLNTKDLIRIIHIYDNTSNLKQICENQDTTLI